MSERAAAIQRKTKETEIKLEVSLDGTGRVRADTGVGFLDHMLDHLGRHSLCDLTVRASGDAPKPSAVFKCQNGFHSQRSRA